ncbi:MAG: hypothetical protein KUG61_10730 [Parvibaculaceae bacterium]|nr:hypothetical protein [Parvibaculaceae bacterium]
MQFMMVNASHSPILDFPARESTAVNDVLAALADTRARIAEFDPELVILFGVDHYGGQQMSCMPSFCVGVEATAIADVGGTAGALNVPRAVAIDAIHSLRQQGVDTAVSYDMAVDHGFSQALKRLTGGLDTYPVLPIFMCCLQPPFVPFARARALGAAVGAFAKTLDQERILFIGTGGLAHDPYILFPPIDEVSEEWRPYILNGKAQNEVSQQSWIDYEIEAHKIGAQFMVDDNLSDADLGLKDDWDKTFMNAFCSGDLSVFDSWEPEKVMENGGIGAVETQSWIAAAQAIKTAADVDPINMFQQVAREIGIGFGITIAHST